MMRSIHFVILSLVLSCASAETIVVGTPPFSPPFIMMADNKNHLIGFSIDIMSAICKRLNIQCEYKALNFNQTFSEVIERKINLAIGSFTITPERETKVLFSLPYLQSQAAFLTLANSSITSIEHLKGKTVAAETDSVFVSYLKKQYGDSIKIVTYPDISELMFALNDGDVDLVIFDKETAYFWMGNNYDMFKLVGKPFPLGIGIGIVANLDDQPLIDRINQTLISMETDGTYLNIYNTYFGDMTKVTSTFH